MNNTTTNQLSAALLNAYDYAFSQWGKAQPGSPAADAAREQLRLIDVAMNQANKLIEGDVE